MRLDEAEGSRTAQMSESQVKFLPFHAINDFMLDDFRLEVIRTALGSLENLSAERRSALNNLIRRLFKIPGFRNSSAAPLALKIRNAEPVFEKSPEFVAEVLAAWMEVHAELAKQAHAFLTGRSWPILPLDAPRTRLPGFLTTWPEAESFEVLVIAFREQYPDSLASDNDISLMVAWLAGRLPLDLVAAAFETPAD